MNTGKKLRLKNVYERRNYLTEEINQNCLMSKRHKTFVWLLASFTVTGCVSISVFASLVYIPIGISYAVVGLNVCPITAEIKKA